MNCSLYKAIKLSVLKECSSRKVLKELTTTYRHFDKPLSNKVKRRIIHNIKQNNDFVLQYRHLPFIEFQIEFMKFNREQKKYLKKRIISLPSHHDALLYKIYSKILYRCYEIYLERKKLEGIPVAYRKGHSNITGAKEVIDRICSFNKTWVIKGDFSHFFDNLNHDVLLKNVSHVISDISKERLPDDWKSVLRSLMNYRYIELKQIKEGVSKNEKASYVRSLSEFDNMVKMEELTISV